MFDGYHTIEDNRLGPVYAGLQHIDSFLKVYDDECVFATALTTSSLELWIDNTETDVYWSVWKLAGEL